MKTTPSVLLAGCLLSMGCLQMGRPPVAPAADPGSYPTELGTPVSPTQVAPRTNSTIPGTAPGDTSEKVLRPEFTPTPADQSANQPSSSPATAAPPASDSGAQSETPAPSQPAPTEEPTTDAPPFESLEAPPLNDEVVPSAQGKPASQLGQSAPWPATAADRSQLTEVSRQQLKMDTELPGWASEYRSTGQRPIQTFRRPGDAPAIMIIGSLYGNEPESVALIDQVVMNSDALVSGTRSLVLVRSANPDGLAEHIRTNLRGVDLNRNFPSTMFTANPSQQTGPQPGSEQETQALMRLLMAAVPGRVIHVRSTVGSRPLVLINDALKARLGQTSLPSYVDWETFDGGFKAGSLEEYVSIRMSAEMMTILLPPQGFPSLSPRQLLELSLLGIDTTAPVKTDLAGNNPAGAGLRDAVTPAASPAKPVQPLIEEIASQPGAKGAVEFLPPPPDTLTSATSASRYYELPPPPGP